jgi:hypothetical protein
MVLKRCRSAAPLGAGSQATVDTDRVQLLRFHKA